MNDCQLLMYYVIHVDQMLTDAHPLIPTYINGSQPHASQRIVELTCIA